VTDPRGLPLAVVAVTGGHRNDVTQLIPLVDAVASMEARDGRLCARLKRIVADRGYDHDKHGMLLRERGIEPVIAQRGTEHGSGLGKERWVVERTISWLHQFRRLRIRWERDAEIHLAFMHLACAIVCWRLLRSL
jgi:transposase